MEVLKIKLTLLEESLGVMAGDPEIFRTYIASKAPDALKLEEEVEAQGVDAVLERSMTVFPKLEDGTPFMWDYQIKGFFKDACGMLRRGDGTASSKVKAFKKEIDGLVFPQPRKIPFVVAGELGVCERPLRAQTPQGERVALAYSETVPAGSSLVVEIAVLRKDLLPMIRECLDYGSYRGLSQWRNSGKGRFSWEEL